MNRSSAFQWWLAHQHQILLISIGWSVFLFFPLLGAKFGLIDDHELVSWFGEGGRLSLSQARQLWLGSEIYDMSFVRFRPTYYTFRVIEAWLWGATPVLWYLTRIVIHGFFIAAVFGFFVTVTGRKALSASFAFFCSTYLIWTDIICRLGPAEFYGVFLGALILSLHTRIEVKKRDCSKEAWWISVCTILLVGCKENMIFFAFSPLLLLIFRRKSFSIASRWGLAVSLVLSAMVAGVSVLRIRFSEAGKDIYGREVSGGRSFELLVSLVVKHPLVAGLLLLTCGMLIWLLVTRRARPLSSDKNLVISIKLSAVVLLSAIIYLSQYVVYQGEWPNSMPRYNFPGIFIILGLYFWAYSLLLDKINGISFRHIGPRLATWLSIIGIGSFGLVGLHAVDKLREKGFLVAAITNETQASLARVKGYVQNSGKNELIVVTLNSIFDYEPCFAILRFLRSIGINNPVSIEVKGFRSTDWPKGELANGLANHLERLEQFGGEGFVASKAVDNEPNCFSIGLSGASSATCKNGTRVVY